MEAHADYLPLLFIWYILLDFFSFFQMHVVERLTNQMEQLQARPSLIFIPWTRTVSGKLLHHLSTGLL